MSTMTVGELKDLLNRKCVSDNARVYLDVEYDKTSLAEALRDTLCNMESDSYNLTGEMIDDIAIAVVELLAELKPGLGGLVDVKKVLSVGLTGVKLIGVNS